MHIRLPALGVKQVNMKHAHPWELHTPPPPLPGQEVARLCEAVCVKRSMRLCKAGSVQGAVCARQEEQGVPCLPCPVIC